MTYPSAGEGGEEPGCESGQRSARVTPPPHVRLPECSRSLVATPDHVFPFEKELAEHAEPASTRGAVSVPRWRFFKLKGWELQKTCARSITDNSNVVSIIESNT
jgi:hypothetical protein